MCFLVVDALCPYLPRSWLVGALLAGAKNALFRAICILCFKRSIYQDMLGTDTEGNRREKEEAFCFLQIPVMAFSVRKPSFKAIYI
jgi:hypothetical protein